MNRVQQGGGMPSMAELMSDPTMRNLCVSTPLKVYITLTDEAQGSAIWGGWRTIIPLLGMTNTFGFVCT